MNVLDKLYDQIKSEIKSAECDLLDEIPHAKRTFLSYIKGQIMAFEEVITMIRNIRKDQDNIKDSAKDIMEKYDGAIKNLGEK